MKNEDLLGYWTILLPFFSLFNRDLPKQNIVDYHLQCIFKHFFLGITHRHCLNFSGALVTKLFYKLSNHVINGGVLPEPNRFKFLSHLIMMVGIYSLLHYLLVLFSLLHRLMIVLLPISGDWLPLFKIRVWLLYHLSRTRLPIYHRNRILKFRPKMRCLIISELLILFNLHFILKSEYPDFNPLQLLGVYAKANLI